MATPQTIERISSELLDLTFDAYMTSIRDALLEGQPAIDEIVVQRTARAILLARLEGAAYAIRPIRRAGVVLKFDDPDDIAFEAEEEAFTSRNPHEAHVAKIEHSELYVDRSKLIQRSNLEKIAKAFAFMVPEIRRRIILEAQLSGSMARQIWAEDSVAIFDIMQPILQRQIEKEGISLRAFFFEGQRATMRQEFGEVARARLENIYRTNLTTAAGEAAWKETHEGPVFDIVSFFEYVAVDDGRVRPHHWAFDGFVQVKDWEGWAVIRVPNGYQCRCAPPVTIFPSEAKRRGLLNDDGSVNQQRLQYTWRNAVSAGLLTPAGQLTYPRVVSMRDRHGNQREDSFPQSGFGG